MYVDFSDFPGSLGFFEYIFEMYICVRHVMWYEIFLCQRCRISIPSQGTCRDPCAARGIGTTRCGAESLANGPGSSICQAEGWWWWCSGMNCCDGDFTNVVYKATEHNAERFLEWLCTGLGRLGWRLRIIYILLCISKTWWACKKRVSIRFELAKLDDFWGSQFQCLEPLEPVDVPPPLVAFSDMKLTLRGGWPETQGDRAQIGNDSGFPASKVVGLWGREGQLGRVCWVEAGCLGWRRGVGSWSRRWPNLWASSGL